MKLLALILITLVSVVQLGHVADRNAVSGLPADVVKFKERRDLCDHFRGEEPYDRERRTFLEENLKRYCTGTDKELASLKTKYKGNETVLKALGEYEVKIEWSN
jgi:hypothetical protein